ncbi:MAG: ATP-binding cassette domain-containing protein [Ktedonobacteraceae bacterium]|nr:ATP-binding cassette domain-containing protein [Ktedonobacteraceae bacterium]
MLSDHDAAIDVQKVVKNYPGAQSRALDDISFSVQRGEIFGLLGPNGAGKTTMINILTTRMLPTAGSVRVMGIDVVKDPISVKQVISVVPQQNNLDQSLPAREVLTFHARYHGIPRAEREARATTLLEELGLGKRGKELVRQYSGGMAQRLMLARALMHSPHVLFLDEPTNSLDPQSRLFLWDRIRALNEQHTTIVLTTHDMEEADRLCHRIAIVDHGKILVLDTPAELKKLIPGGSCLELHVHLPELVATGDTGQHASLPPHVLDALSHLPGVVKVEEVAVAEESVQAGSLVRLYAENAGALVTPVAQIISGTDIELLNLRIANATLEEVFISLTGRNLR